MTPDVLRFINVSKSFASPGGSVTVLEHINLAIHPGEFVGLTGPSGSGKSTLLNLAALLDTPSTGHIEFEQQRIDPENEEQLRHLRSGRIGMVFQRFHLLPNRSVLDNVLFRFRYMQAHPSDVLPRSLELIERLGLAELTHQPVHLLSGGEMQRVAVARAAVTRPALLLADEPTGNLDQNAGREVMRCLQDLNRQGVTVVVATHNLEWLSYCQRHMVCNRHGVEDACAA